jgi:hypothetical protein
MSAPGVGTVAPERVLYLYNAHGWAIHQVGLQWSSTVADRLAFDCVRFGAHESRDPGDYDRVVLGYSTIGYSGRMLLAALALRPRRWWRWGTLAPERLATVVHDPSELFPEAPDWKTRTPRLAHLRRFGRVATASRELEAVLTAHGIAVVRVPTRSRLPLRDPATLREEPLRAYSRAQRYPRKDLPMLERLAAGAHRTGHPFTLEVGGHQRPAAEYAARLDAQGVYVCTSWQEGGPLPLLDAMRRGCAVLTTRVGQTDEWVEHGVSGWFCDTEADFAARLSELAADPARLLAMRRAALARAAGLDDVPVRAGLLRWLGAPTTAAG